MEQIISRTVEQEQELKDLKQELSQLEKQQEQNPNKTNWISWIIGGGILIVLVIGIIAYFWGKSKGGKQLKN